MKNACLKWALVSVMALGAMGCVSQKDYDALRITERRSEEQIVDLRSALEEAQSRLHALQEAAKMPDPDMVSKMEKAIADRDQMAKALSDAMERLRLAGLQGMALPTDLNKALTDLANSDPNLMEFDPKLGMIKFRSDLTFASGSAEVNPEARASLEKLAGILKSEIAAKFEARIVGHTDNVPVSRSSTKARHPDNWYLSAHRAIAVEEVLQKDGVPPVRLGVAGYGQYRPVVPNMSKGAEGNRRVEIYLFPSTYNGMNTEDAAAPHETTPTPPAHRPDTSEPPEMYK